MFEQIVTATLIIVLPFLITAGGAILLSDKEAAYAFAEGFARRVNVLALGTFLVLLTATLAYVDWTRATNLMFAVTVVAPLFWVACQSKVN